MGGNRRAEGYIRMLRSLGGSTEVLRMTAAMPQWIPGLLDGKAVDVQFNLPVKFKIDDESAPEYALELRNFSASPNPSNGILQLTFEADAVATDIIISHQDGRVVRHLSLPGFNGLYSETIDLSREAKGVYILSVRQGDK